MNYSKVFYNLWLLLIPLCIMGLIQCSDRGITDKDEKKIKENPLSFPQGKNQMIPDDQNKKDTDKSKIISIFMCGDVMTGRGIDQILPHPVDPHIYEPYVRNAKDYVKLAEITNGPIKKPVNFDYIWGYALEKLDKMNPDVRIINLETSITGLDEFREEKGINYRMHPQNIKCITAAKIDFCSLANNHIIDWGRPGLTETLKTLRNAGIQFSGAGENRKAAETPAIIKVKHKGRVIIFSYGHGSGGVPHRWAATDKNSGVNLLEDFSKATISKIKKLIDRFRRDNDIAILSIHWGYNWGYDIPKNHVQFAHDLIDSTGVDIIWGHSSHHVIGIEIYKDKPILYGCGDFINDYEGIKSYESFRDDLSLMYFLDMNAATGKLISLRMVPTQIKNMRVNRAESPDIEWMQQVLNREGKKFNNSAELKNNDYFLLKWK